MHRHDILEEDPEDDQMDWAAATREPPVRIENSLQWRRILRSRCGLKPGIYHGVEEADGCGDVDERPCGNLNLGDEGSDGDHHAIEDEGEDVGHNLPHEEEVVDQIELLP